MKKNKMMRLASALLVLVLLTTCAISGTFAKYVSSASAEDEARVAYWGWGSDATIEFDLFDGDYDDTVKSENGDNLVAPGTNKSATFTFAYKPTENGQALNAGAINAPEVDYTFAIDFAIEGDYDQLDANPNFVWTLNGEEYQKVEQLEAAVLALAGDASGSKDYEAGTLPEKFATETNDAVANTIGWKWIFETDADTAADGMQADAAQDELDTAMGNAADLDDLTISITVSATQID